MQYFAGLDSSMNETHICVVDRDGKVALSQPQTPDEPRPRRAPALPIRAPRMHSSIR